MQPIAKRQPTCWAWRTDWGALLYFFFLFCQSQQRSLAHREWVYQSYDSWCKFIQGT